MRVKHIVNVQYGSYSEIGYEVICDKDDDMGMIKSIVKRRLHLNFLPMAYFSVQIISTEPIEEPVK